ncbi:hypothetical protein, partial [Sphingomonas sp. PAMC 26605]|uniref:hypothetical protein n=1 Tax=Sphingomonas sp. PAMC 26605 TaxID=1112214 RepID=UPI00026CB1C9
YVAGEVLATMAGPDAIAAGVAHGVGAGVIVHHLFSHEIEIESSALAHEIWSMEDWIDRSDEPGTISLQDDTRLRPLSHSL